MNTRGGLRRCFAAAGMVEEAFLRLDDCRTFAKFEALNRAELAMMRACRAVGVPYPCLLYTSPSPRDLSTSRMPSSA